VNYYGRNAPALPTPIEEKKKTAIPAAFSGSDIFAKPYF
jgi:hypothetical protein